LSQTGFTTYIGPIDIDVNIDSSNYDPEKSKALALEYARRLAHYAPEMGLGKPNWFSVSWIGGFHADLMAAPDIIYVNLIHAVRLLVERLAIRTEVPLYLRMPPDFKNNRAHRSDVYLDDSVLNKNASARGGLWRLPDKSKPKGKKKTLVDILKVGCPRIEESLSEPIDSDALREAIKLYGDSRKKIKKEKKESTPLSVQRPREIIEIYDTPSAALPE